MITEFGFNYISLTLLHYSNLYEVCAESVVLQHHPHIEAFTVLSAVLTSDMSWTSSRGTVTVVTSCVQQTFRMFLKPMIAGSRAVMFPERTLSSTHRWKTTWTSDRLECREM